MNVVMYLHLSGHTGPPDGTTVPAMDRMDKYYRIQGVKLGYIARGIFTRTPNTLGCRGHSQRCMQYPGLGRKRIQQPTLMIGSLAIDDTWRTHSFGKVSRQKVPNFAQRKVGRIEVIQNVCAKECWPRNLARRSWPTFLCANALHHFHSTNLPLRKAWNFLPTHLFVQKTFCAKTLTHLFCANVSYHFLSIHLPLRKPYNLLLWVESPLFRTSMVHFSHRRNSAGKVPSTPQHLVSGNAAEQQPWPFRQECSGCVIRWASTVIFGVDA